ncbi:Sensor histidine kinase/response regulator [Rhodovulum sp. P5]|uniref:PAS domain-containing hybrid sensor histidine kinase/response regulator n=1 Tax=Rhodovulum sp. P5 TaxID=1564506 RepID=UPI0009C1E953|nr:PAS-domain containing protein [Rhodovulum sp. P5]ARE40777.1 Sensor histidine kinase/response regulator [Rhodovulum sp. P5]
MTYSLIDPSDSVQRQNEKLQQIVEVLMKRVEQSTDDSGAAYAQFQRVVMLEDEVRDRTRDLEHALDLLNQSNAQLAEANRATEAARSDLANAIETIQEGFALFDRNDALVLCNSRFSMQLPDVREILRPGLSFRAYVEAVSESQFLSLPAGETPRDWATRRLNRHRDSRVVLNVRLIWNRWVQISEHHTGDGQTVILQTDITDIMRLERRERDRMLDDQARLIRATLDHINQGVCIFDTKARLVGWNGKVGEMLSIPVSQFRFGADFDRIFDRLINELQFTAGLAPDKLLSWVHQDDPRPPLRFEIRRGDAIILDVFAEEMPNREFVISFNDVTARRQAAEALQDAKAFLEQRVMERTLELEDALAEAERANASKSRFVAAASHDLLQPLSAAKLYVSSITDDLEKPAHAEVLRRTERALESVEDIIGALLDISTLDSGQVSIDLAPVDVTDLFAHIHAEFAAHADLKGLDLRIRPRPAFIRTDARYIRRILQNLVANAVRYTERGSVLVGARRRGRSLRLEVWDTGPGIAEEDQDTIFREFQRLNARASASEGMGLGLAIVERACARLGHPLGLWSQPGRGSGFFVTVPLDPGPGPVSARLPVQRAPAHDVAGLAVLLVENDSDMRRALSMVLERRGVNLLSVENTAEALALLDEIALTPDAMLVDYHLDGDETGVEAIRAIRAVYGAIPARIITANRAPEVADACRAAQIDLLHKPLSTAEVEAFLHAAAPA